MKKDFVATVLLGVTVSINIDCETEVDAVNRLDALLETREYRLQLIKEAYENGASIYTELDEIECVGHSE